MSVEKINLGAEVQGLAETINSDDERASIALEVSSLKLQREKVKLELEKVSLDQEPETHTKKFRSSTFDFLCSCLRDNFVLRRVLHDGIGRTSGWSTQCRS